MQATKIRVLLAAVAVTAVVVWLVIRVAFGAVTFHWSDLLFPWAMTAVCAWGARKVGKAREDHGIGQDGSQMHPLTAARWVTVGTASAWLGALLAGGYLGVCGWLLPQWAHLAAAGEEGPVVIVGVVSGVALAAAGLWLERSGHITPGDMGDEPGGLPEAGAAPR